MAHDAHRVWGLGLLTASLLLSFLLFIASGVGFFLFFASLTLECGFLTPLIFLPFILVGTVTGSLLVHSSPYKTAGYIIFAGSVLVPMVFGSWFVELLCYVIRVQLGTPTV